MRHAGHPLDTTAKTLPAAGDGSDTVTAWWELPGQTRYLREHLIEHMLAAGRHGQAEETAADLRWVDSRLRASGPAGPSADLALVGTPQAERLRRVLAQSAHLLAPTDPPYSLTDILYSRVSHDPDWGPQARVPAAACKRPALISERPLPDLPQLGLLRTLVGHAATVNAVTVAPNGTWLATASDDGTVRIWEAATGAQRAVLDRHAGQVTAVAIAPDGTWLATAGNDGTVRTWEAATGAQQARLDFRVGMVNEVAIAPDGAWLVAVGADGEMVIWRTAARAARIIDVHASRLTAVAIAPDGTWLAAAHGDGTVRIWEVATGVQRAILDGRAGRVCAAAVAPDGSRLASVGDDRAVRIWDLSTGDVIAITRVDSGLRDCTWSPSGYMLAAVGDAGLYLFTFSS